MITRKELIKVYIEFFESYGHKEITNASLIPENNSTVLFTTAGMHPLVPFLLGQPHPLGKKLTNVQKCIRTGDIEEVGDTTHHTFFEMLGNWSLGDYGKKEAIEMSFEFLTKELKIPKEKLAVTVFKGNQDSPKDEESKKTWESLEITKEKIAFLGKEDNWWGPAGITGPCGPDTEMFVWKSKEPVPEKFDPNNKNWVEIWNDVLMEYTKDENGDYNESKQKNIDTGMGVERVLAILNNLEDNYESEVWKPIINEIEHLSNKKYEDYKREMRIIADHIKAATFILAEGITPSNTEQGYVLRRLIRRTIINLKKLGFVGTDLIFPIAEKVIEIYSDYEHLQKKKSFVYEELNKEEEKFEKTLDKGLNELKKIAEKTNFKNKISGKNVFLLFQSYGFPMEMTKEIALKEYGMQIDEEGFLKEQQKHQELSQTASAGMFKSGLADHSESTTKLHTAAHLLLEALKKTLGNEIAQKGSNITPERLRFDFSFDRKLTEDEKQKIENLVNEQIEKKEEVVREEMSPEEAKNKGASGIFDSKYGNIVSVYTIGNFSKEICTGPHVKNTSELGKFKIAKEESCSSGVRRIKAILE